MIEKWTQLRFEELGAALAAEEDLTPDPSPLHGEGGMVISPGEARLRSESARMALEEPGRMPFAPTGEGGIAGWWEEYVRLRGYGWPWRVAVYVAWAALPKERRWPRSQDELAREVLGLTSDRVIYQWKKKNPGIEDAIAVLQGGVLFEHRAGVIEALVESAKNPNYKGHQDRKLFFEMIGDYTPRSEQSVKVSGEGWEDLSGVSEEELRKLAGKVIEEPSTNAEESIPLSRINEWESESGGEESGDGEDSAGGDGKEWSDE